MKCPFCRDGDFAVIDSRTDEDGFPVRRRRQCTSCNRKVWTVEQVVETPLKVIKKDQSRELFDHHKLRRGLEKACFKRPISTEQLDSIVRQVKQESQAEHFAEVPVRVIGELVMQYLKQLDQVAYVRFASVYREFADVNDFVEELQPMLAEGKRRKKAK
jgi:transcriptional repressor NrdR